MKIQHWIAAGCLLAVPVASQASLTIHRPTASMLAAAGTDALNGVNDEVSSFTVDNQTQVPGKTLKAGEYTIRIVDHLSDRMIVRIDRNGKQETTFLALPASGLQKPSQQGPIKLVNGKGKNALRGFSFPNGTLAEFVYPKEEAVGIAKANNTKIPAVDPASEGLPADSALSSDDMKMVTLWMLSPVDVGPEGNGKGIAAERYQASRQAAAVPAPRPAAVVPASRQSATVSQSQQVASARAPQQVASAQTPPHPRARPIMAVLPHTAGSLPLVMLTGLFSFGFAAALARRRKSVAC